MIKVEFTPNQLHFDSTGAINALVDYFVKVIEFADQEYLKLMADELNKAGGGPRDRSSHITGWKNIAQSQLKEVNIDIAKGYIESTVGIEGNYKDAVWRKANIIASGGGPSESGPKGKSVWDEDYNYKHPSTAPWRKPKRLPATWKLDGNDWVKNAAKRMETYYNNFLQSACDALPENFFAKFLN